MKGKANQTHIKQRCYRYSEEELAKKYEVIKCAVEKLIDENNAVFSNELMTETGITRERIVICLKTMGFVRSGGRIAKRWVNPKYPNKKYDNSHKIISKHIYCGAKIE